MKTVRITASLDKGNEVGVVLEPEIGVSGNVKPVAQVMPAAKNCVLEFAIG